jgi:hypothetical protein
VILSSGYSESDITKRLAQKRLTGFAGFIQKPYQMKELALKLREIIEGQKVS